MYAYTAVAPGASAAVVPPVFLCHTPRKYVRERGLRASRHPRGKSMPHHNFDEIVDRFGTGSYKWDKYPADVIPLWVADTDFRAPQPVVEALAKRVSHGVFGYSSENGRFERVTGEWTKRRYGWDIDPGWVYFVPSVVAGLGLGIRALTEPGDAVVIQPPVYPPFFSTVRANGRIPLENPLVWRDGTWHIDFDGLEAGLADPRSTLLLLCNPHNPTGRCFTREELLRMGELCLRHGVRVLSDEIHADFVYTGKHIPFPTLSAELAAVSAVCLSPSKTFNIADLRMSAMIAPGEETAKMVRKERRAAAFGHCSLGDAAYETAYGECDYYADQVRDYLGGNLDRAVAYFHANIPEIAAYKPEATFLLWLDCRKLGLPQPELVSFFVEKAKVALNSGTDFGPEGEGFMRMNVGCPAARLTEALERIAHAVRDARPGMR